MNVEDFRKHGKEMIDYICNYAENIAERDVAPTLDPGYLKQLLPSKLLWPKFKNRKIIN